MNKIEKKTIFCDIDGTIFRHQGNLSDMIKIVDLLPGVIEKFLSWRDKDYYIVLTTARPEGCRLATEMQLNNLGIFFDQLVMGLNTGPRVLINDKKTDGSLTSYCINIERDRGLRDIEI